MIVLFTDYGLAGPYTGQLKAVLHREAPAVPVVDLFADAPVFDPRASAYLLAAFVREFPEETVFCCVVDPGVGGERDPLLVNAGQRWFVGPDNGLFEIVARRAEKSRWWKIAWQPAVLSATFHGRDLFAPIAARLAQSDRPSSIWTDDCGDGSAFRHPDWPDDLPQIVYIDHFCNAMTGMRAARLGLETKLIVGKHRLARARTFGDVVPGTPFWHENANGLAEIAVNRGHAASILGLTLGGEVAFEDGKA